MSMLNKRILTWHFATNIFQRKTAGTYDVNNTTIVWNYKLFDIVKTNRLLYNIT